MISANNRYHRLLTNRNFVLLWFAYAISVLGDHLSELAILKVHGGLNTDVDITPLQARMMFMFMFPFFAFGPVMGALADRFSRKGLMIIADLVRALIMFSFYWLIGIFIGFEGWGTFVPIAFVGIFAAMFSPARSSIIPIIVESGQLIRANALISALGIIVTMCSVLLSGYLADRYDPVVSFRIDGFTFIVSAALLFNMRLISKHKALELTQTYKDDAQQKNSYTGISIKSLKNGFRYALSHKRVFQLIILATIFWICGATVRSVMPAIVKDVYFGTFQQIGLFQVWLGLGLVSGAIVINILGRILRSEIAITWGFLGAGFSAMILCWSIFIDLNPATAHVIGACAVYGMGFFGVGISIGYNTLLQRIVSNNYRGRVFGILDLCTVFGLLLATGVLAMPHWPHLDEWIVQITFFVAITLIVTGFTIVVVKLSNNPHRFFLTFFININKLLCKIWYGFKMVGQCTIPRTGPVILVANHASIIDPAILCAAIKYRCPSFLIAKEYSNIPILRFFVKLMECIPVKRNGQDINATKAAITHLRAGKILVIFIQGGIPSDGRRRELKNGAAILALRTGATVIPAYISGTVHRKSIIADLIFRHKARVKFGPPVDLSKIGRSRKRQEAVLMATDEIYSNIVALDQAI